VRQMTEMPQRK